MVGVMARVTPNEFSSEFQGVLWTEGPPVLIRDCCHWMAWISEGKEQHTSWCEPVYSEWTACKSPLDFSHSNSSTCSTVRWLYATGTHTPMLHTWQQYSYTCTKSFSKGHSHTHMHMYVHIFLHYTPTAHTTEAMVNVTNLTPCQTSLLTVHVCAVAVPIFRRAF